MLKCKDRKHRIAFTVNEILVCIHPLINKIDYSNNINVNDVYNLFAEHVAHKRLLYQLMIISIHIEYANNA